MTGIEWTDRTWNPVVGCTKVSAGCKNCYAKTEWDRRHKGHLAGKKVAPQYAQPFEVLQLMPERLPSPLGWRKPARVFVNSVSRNAGVPVFVKQLGAAPVEFDELEGTPGGRTFHYLKLQDRKGGNPEEWPEDLRVRQFPEVRRAS